jgi:hypothetical protein
LVSFWLGEIRFEEFEVWVIQMLFDVRFLERTIIKWIKVIDAKHLMPVGKQAIEGV